MNKKKKKKCPHCGGYGFVPNSCWGDFEIMGVCSQCGEIHEGTHSCELCGGTGEIEEEEEEEEKK